MFLAALVLGSVSPAPPQDLARLLSPDSGLVVGGPGLGALLAADEPPAWFLRLSSPPVGREALRPAVERLRELDSELDLPVVETLASLMHHGVVLGVELRREQPAISIAARAADAETLSDVLAVLERGLVARQGLPSRWLARQRRSVRGFDAWIFDELAFAVEGDLWLLANGEGALRDMIDRRLDGGPSAADGDALRAAADDADAGLWAWLDVDWLAAVDADAAAGLRALATEPGVHLLFGSGVAGLGDARTLSAAVWVDDHRLKLAVRGHGRVTERPFELGPPPTRGGPATVDARADGARLVLHRDLAGLFRHRVELFDVEDLPEFANAISSLALFFGGADIEDEILPALSPWLTLVVREPTFEAGTSPDVPLPAAALIVEIDDAEHVGPQLISAFQTAVGLVNVQSAQDMRPALVMGLELVGDVMMTTARFPTPRPEEGVDVRYNLVPACAVAGDRLVIGTHRSVVAEVVAELASAASTAGPPPAGETVRLAGPFLARGLRANADALAMARVLRSGDTPDEGRAWVASVADLVEAIDQLELRFVRRAAETRELSLQLRFGGEGR